MALWSDRSDWREVTPRSVWVAHGVIALVVLLAVGAIAAAAALTWEAATALPLGREMVVLTVLGLLGRLVTLVVLARRWQGGVGSGSAALMAMMPGAGIVGVCAAIFGMVRMGLRR